MDDLVAEFANEKKWAGWGEGIKGGIKSGTDWAVKQLGWLSTQSDIIGKSQAERMAKWIEQQRGRLEGVAAGLLPPPELPEGRAPGEEGEAGAFAVPTTPAPAAEALRKGSPEMMSAIMEMRRASMDQAGKDEGNKTEKEHLEEAKDQTQILEQMALNAIALGPAALPSY
jgi:hypothetical protein